ncbi:MAG: hypothetical protein P8183_21785 [Anaerolineae bacterium]
MEKKVRWLAGLLLVTAVTFILLISWGTFDPQPVGSLQWELPLSPQAITMGAEAITWLNVTTPVQDYSLRLKMTHQSGERDVLYGLVIGGENVFWATAVSPLGYVAIWQQHPPATNNQQPTTNYYFPFQTWPHVQPDANEIWLDVVNGRATVRVNRELLWQGEVAPAAGQIGLWLESFGGTAVVEFQSLQLFAD